eukprot:SAG22_NODE_8187_length_676_cov_0.840555_1_plen_77_part_00
MAEAQGEEIVDLSRTSWFWSLLDWCKGGGNPAFKYERVGEHVEVFLERRMQSILKDVDQSRCVRAAATAATLAGPL